MVVGTRPQRYVERRISPERKEQTLMKLWPNFDQRQMEPVLEPSWLGLAAVVHGGICQAYGSSGGFCQGWQLVAEVANEKNTLFFPVHLIYEFWLETPTRRMSAESQVVQLGRELSALPPWVAEQPLSVLHKSLRGCTSREVDSRRNFV
jgi:hypothetical protein